MILIADSGATKTDWKLIDSSKTIYSYSTQGISPYFLNTEQIVDLLKKELIINLDKNIFTEKLNIYYYGTGCAADQKSEIVYKALNSIFLNSNIIVNTDMLGAARALCGDKEGMVAILGTGSNAGYYNGKFVRHDTMSLGYILGDEGSGANIGKTFIIALLNDEVPSHISQLFFKQFEVSKSDIIDSVYKKTLPNRYLASYCKFVKSNINEKYLYNLVLNSFDLFLQKHICKYPEHKSVALNLVGSIAFHFSDILSQSAEKYNVSIGKIITSPINELVDYHAIR